MALPIGVDSSSTDPRALVVLAKSIYRELRTAGYETSEVMTLASELLGLVTTEMQDRRFESLSPPPPPSGVSLVRDATAPDASP
jgi:hypothetical protein